VLIDLLFTDELMFEAMDSRLADFAADRVAA
jgi:hypothetical protein